MARQKITRKRSADVATRCLEDLARYKKEKIDTSEPSQPTMTAPSDGEPPPVPVVPANGAKVAKRSDLFRKYGMALDVFANSIHHDDQTPKTPELL